MKRIATAVVLGSLIVATQLASAQSFTEINTYGGPARLPALSTYADAHAGDAATMTGSVIPDQSQPEDGIPALGTYSDVHAGDRVTMSGSAIPDQSQPEDGIPALNTYADSHLRIGQPAQSSYGSGE